MSPESFNPNQPSPDTKDRLVLRSDNTISVMTESGNLSAKGNMIMYGMNEKGQQIQKSVDRELLSDDVQNQLASELAASLSQPDIDDDVTHDRGELLASLEANEHELTPAEAFQVEVGSAAVALSSIESAPVLPNVAESEESPSVESGAEAAAIAQEALEHEARAKQEKQAQLDETDRTTRQIKSMFDQIRNSVNLINRGANIQNQLDQIAGGVMSMRSVSERYRMPSAEKGSAEIDARLEEMSRVMQGALQSLEGVRMAVGRPQGAEAFAHAQGALRKIEESIDAIDMTKKRLLIAQEATSM